MLMNSIHKMIPRTIEINETESGDIEPAPSEPDDNETSPTTLEQLETHPVVTFISPQDPAPVNEEDVNDTRSPENEQALQPIGGATESPPKHEESEGTNTEFEEDQTDHFDESSENQNAEGGEEQMNNVGKVISARAEVSEPIPNDEVKDETTGSKEENETGEPGNSEEGNDKMDNDQKTEKENSSTAAELSSQEEFREQMQKEKREVREIGGLGIFLAIVAMIFTAWQISDNPDGLYAAMCRLIITVLGLITRLLLSPCWGYLGGGSANRQYGHVPVSTMDYGYRDPSLELS